MGVIGSADRALGKLAGLVGKGLFATGKGAVKGTAEAATSATAAVLHPHNIARDIGYAESISTFIGGVGDTVAEGAMGAFKKTKYEEGANILEKALHNPFGYELKKPYAYAIGALVLLPSVADSGAKIHNKNHMGRMQGEQLVNQVNPESVSPGLEDPNQMAELGRTGIKKHLTSGTLNTYGAEGDIVFALHNLRGR